jgi:N-acetylglucosamine kinase-like BadF-type ATPase
MVFLGIDVGGSKTHALLSDENGQVLGFGVGPGGNPEMVGYDGLTLAMQAALQKACKSSGVKRMQIAAAGFGIAGYDWPFQYAATLQAVQALRLRTEILAIENDAVTPIYGGTTHGWGIAACVGTGNNVRGVDAQGRTGRITGNSSTFGEFGGAGEIMQTVLQRLAWMWTGRGKATALAEILVRDCGASDLGDLIEGLVAERYHLKADQAPLVVQVAESGDVVAGEVLTWNARELAASVLAVAGQLDLIEQPFEVVMSGKLYQVSNLYCQTFKESVLHEARLAECKLFTSPPVVGAVIMAMQAAQAAGVGVTKARAALLGIDFKNNTY